MADSDLQWFTSDIDRLIGSILVVVPALELGMLAWALVRGDREAAVASSIGCLLVAAIYVLLVVPVRYALAEDALIVRFGVMRQRIPYTAIQEVYPTRSPLSSAALSLNRLAIRTGRAPLGLTLISPRQRDEFLSLLSDKAHLIRAGDRLTPRSTSL